MFESTKRTKMRAFWPDVSSEEGAITAAHQAMWACFIVAGITAVFAAVAVAGSSAGDINGGAFIDAAVFAGLGWGIRRYSRTAAVIALLFFLAEKIMMWSTTGAQGIHIAIIVILALGSGIRGTFAYQSLRQQQLAPVTGPGTVG